jgi:hypothetical protein
MKVVKFVVHENVMSRAAGRGPLMVRYSEWMVFEEDGSDDGRLVATFVHHAEAESYAAWKSRRDRIEARSFAAARNS